MMYTNIRIPDARLYGQAALFPKVNKAVADGDGMVGRGSLEQYFSVGASALAVILEALAAARVRPATRNRVLDYGCGYGRVLRWLRARFPNAYLLGVDADAKAAAAASRVLGIETRCLNASLKDMIDVPFDLIWVGSLLTHLPEAETARVLRYLKAHLAPAGVLVFTTHGCLVAQRLASGKRSYKLDADGAMRVVQGLQDTGYGFAQYPNARDYGISAVSASRMISIADQAGLRTLFFRDRGWAAHQDVYGCVAD